MTPRVLLLLGLALGLASCFQPPHGGYQASKESPSSVAAPSFLRVRWDAIPSEGDDFTAGEEVVDPAGRVRLTTVTWGIEVDRCWCGKTGWQQSRGRVGELGAEGRLACQRVFEERAQQLWFGDPSRFPPDHVYRVDREGDRPIRSLTFTRVEEDGRSVEVRAEFSDDRAVTAPWWRGSIPWVSTYSRDGKPSVEIRVSSAEWCTPSDNPFAAPPPPRSIEGDDVCLCCGGRPLEVTKLGEVPSDSLRDPETQVAALFPQADRYATRLMSFLRKGGEQAWMEAGAEMGGPWDKDTEGFKTVYPFYPAYEKDKLIGYVFCSSSSGAHGRVQLAVALDLEGKPIAAQIQAINSPEASLHLWPRVLLNPRFSLPPQTEPTHDTVALQRCLRKARILYRHFFGL